MANSASHVHEFFMKADNENDGPFNVSSTAPIFKTSLVDEINK